MGLGATADNDCATAGCPLHLSGDFFPDLERPNANVGADRHHKLCRIMRKRVDCSRHDAGYCASPSCMHRTHLSARRMPNQDGHAIGRARGNREAFGARNQGIAFHVGDRFDDVGCRDLPHMSPVHLPLREETILANPKVRHETCAILANRTVVIP